jgi:hypothetical protein
MDTVFSPAAAGVGGSTDVRRWRKFSIDLFTTRCRQGRWQCLYPPHLADFSRLIQADYFRECKAVLRLEDNMCHHMTVNHR